MSLRTSILFVLALAGLAGLGIWLALPRPIDFEDASPEEWASRLGDPLHPEVRSRAERDLIRGGPEAVPVLAQLLRADDVATRKIAARVLGHLGPVARDTASALSEALSHPDVGLRRAAMTALGQIESGDPVVVARLVERLGDEDPKMRIGAAHALGRSGSAAASATEALGRMAADAREGVTARFKAIEAICGIGPAARAAAADLKRVLEDEDPTLRALAAGALGLLDSDTTDALPVLFDMLKGPADEAFVAALAIAQYGTRARAAVPLLEARLEGASPGPRGLIAFALARVDEHPERHVRALAALLDSNEPGVARSSAIMLGALGPLASPALPALNRLVDRPHLGSHALQAIGRIRGEESLPADTLTFSR